MIKKTYNNITGKLLEETVYCDLCGELGGDYWDTMMFGWKLTTKYKIQLCTEHYTKYEETIDNEIDKLLSKIRSNEH